MYVIQKTDAVNILKKYNIFEKVIELNLEKYYTSQDFVCMVIRVTCSSDEYIIKIITENKRDLLYGNKQSDFSENLRKEGLQIPHKYKTYYGDYILQYQINGDDFLIQVEDYFGEDVEKIDYALAHYLGDFLGKLHSISIEKNYKLGSGSTYRAIINNKVEFNKICEDKFIKQLDSLFVKQVLQEHNNSSKSIQNIWKKLPKTAVHADLGLISNIVHNKSGFGVIDFNLAGDESILGDLLITWYSSRYSMTIAGTMTVVQIEKLRKIYFDAYFKNRGLLQIEKKFFEKIASFFNGVYFAKFLNTLFCYGYEKEAILFSEYMIDNYHKIDFGLDMRI